MCNNENKKLNTLDELAKESAKISAENQIKKYGRVLTEDESKAETDLFLEGYDVDDITLEYIHKHMNQSNPIDRLNDYVLNVGEEIKNMSFPDIGELENISIVAVYKKDNIKHQLTLDIDKIKNKISVKNRGN